MTSLRTLAAMLCACTALAVLSPPLLGAAPAPVATSSKVAYRSPPPRSLRVRSATALVFDRQAGRTLYAKNSETELPIASLTKLMTAMVLLDSDAPLDETIEITNADVDRLRYSRSRLPVGTVLDRRELLQLALIASENRAAAALARTFPGGRQAFLAAMNHKAAALGMRNTTLVDATGLHSENTSTAEDLAHMATAALEYPFIREVTTMPALEVETSGRRARALEFRNTNYLVRREHWDIGLSKTGYIKESGRCLLMQAQIADRDLIIVLLAAQGKYTGFGDANRIRKWLETASARVSP